MNLKIATKMDSAVLLHCKSEIQKSSECFISPLSAHNKPSIIVFKRSYSEASIFWKDIHLLFAEIKKSVFIIKTLALDKTDLIQTEDPLKYAQNSRTDILKVFQCILNNLHFLNSCSSSDIKLHSKTVNNLVRGIKNLLIFVGRIDGIPNIVNITDYGSDNHYYYVHLCLELWYNSIKVLVAVNCLPLNEGTFESLCCDLNQLDNYMQAITLLVIDYIFITIKIYKNLNSLCSSPFICKCFEDFWRMLIKIFNTKLADEKYSFWTVFHNAIQNVQKHMSSEKSAVEVPIDAFTLVTEPIECSQISESCLWLTSHIAPLYTLSNNTEERTVSGYPVVKLLIHSLLMSNSGRTEKNLRCALFYTWKIVSLWEPSPEVLLTLTDFYIKNIDETYSLNGNGLEDLPYLFNEPISWFKYIDNLSNTSVMVRNETSLYLYLRILYKQLSMDSNEGNLWRSLKGRVYSKFMPKKLIELSDVGLQNSFSLILTIAASGQLEALDKISSLVSIFKTCSTKKQIVSWKALFVLMLIYQKKGLNLNKIVTKAVDLFNAKCSEYSATKDFNKLNLMNLLLIYIDGMKDVFKLSDCLKLSECELVASGFSILLASCGVSELYSILHILLEIFQKVLDIASHMDALNNSIILTECLKFLDLSFKYVFPFLKKISETDTAPVVVSDISATLTNLSNKFALSLTGQEHNYLSIFEHFVCKNSLNTSVMCHYLCLVLNDKSLQTSLQKVVQNFTSKIFVSWLKLVIDPPTLSPSCEEVHELTFKVLLLSEFIELFPKVQFLDFRSEPSDIAIKVFETMGQTIEEISDFRHKLEIKNKVYDYFQNFSSHVSSRIKKHSGISLTLVYKLISFLIEHCALLLHKCYNCDSILLQLFDHVILPNKVFPTDQHAQSVLCLAVNDFLPRIFKGILKLDYRKDQFVLRTVKQMLINHIFTHPSKNSSIKKMLIATICNRPDSLKWEEFDFLLDNIIECIKESFEKGNPENPALGFELMFELFEVAPLNKKESITNHLLKSALHTYMKETKLSEYLWHLICKIFANFKKSVDMHLSKKILVDILTWFIQEKIQSCQNFSSKRGFSVLDCLSDYLPEVVLELVPFLNVTIRKMESNRGSGEDIILRSHLTNTTTKLQRKLIST